MNNNTTFYNIIPSGGAAEPFLPRWFFYFIGSSQPKTTDSDYIENKTTSGGLTLIKSMTQNSFIKSFIKFMQCSLGNIRPHVIFNRATNLNRTLILERKA